jgi:hypothetical protein
MKKPQMKTTEQPRTIEATPTDFCRWLNWSRERVKAITSKLTPSRQNGRVLYFDVGQFVIAAKAEPESHTQRKQRLDADLAEERLNQMRSESIDLKMSRDILADIMRMHVEAVKAFPDISEKSRQSMLKSMRANTTRLLADLETCRYPESARHGLGAEK